MARELFTLGLLIVGQFVHYSSCTEGGGEENHVEFMSRKERNSLKEEARDMFYHAYNAYMDNAYPADELMPLSCKGRYRGSEPDRGDIDSTLGNFSLTLVDTLDTLVVLGDLGEFENAVKLIVKNVTFDTDVIVSLFETNIRMLGGLLSGHILAEYLQIRADIMPWYRGELLALAKDLGYRFLPAFNTTTGIPYGRINLQNGMKGIPAEMCRETCTACAGSMILEMATLSRLTGETIFEEKAQKAMDALWRMRHRGTDLMGSVLNVHSGDWVRRDSGVGAGIDSYYEYCLKAYILLGDEKYLGRFNKHYQAVMKYVSQGPMLLDVHMHRPNTNSKNFMDALLAFWPGLQVLKGDIKPAVETHEMLYQVMQRHNFIPEAFTTDFQVHWGHHPLRPEFLESTYFLYRATGDHYYLGVGRKVLKSLQTYARVPCGYAAVSDVRTNKHDDTMESFVLSETFKYLFLLFAEPSELVLDLDEFIFTTEGHLLPLTLAAVRSNFSTEIDLDAVEVEELDRTCPNSLHLFPASVRQPLRNMVEDVCPRRTIKRRLSASQFQANNLDHLKMLSNMGITILTSADGRIQLLHTFSNARTVQDAEEGLMFMQEMVELSKRQAKESETRPIGVTYLRKDIENSKDITLIGGPAQFGSKLRGNNKIIGKPVLTEPPEGCDTLTNMKMIKGNIALVSRGNCMFIEKAKIIQEAGALAGIVLDTTIGSSSSTSPMFAMSGDGTTNDDITIPFVFLFNTEATELVRAIIDSENDIIVTIGDYTGDDVLPKSPDDDKSMFERIKSSVKEFLSRPVTTQSLAASTIVTSSESQSENEIFENEEDLVIEHGKLRAFIPKSLMDEDKKTRQTVPLIKITTETTISMEAPVQSSSSATTTTTTTTTEIDLSSTEKVWRAVKQILMNQIHAKTKKPPFKIIPLTQIEAYYEWLDKERNDATDKSLINRELNTVEIVQWFLKELDDIEPKLEVFDPFNELPPTLARKLKSRLLQVNKNSKEMEALIEMVESYKVYDNLLENIQDVLKNLRTEFKKASKISSKDYSVEELLGGKMKQIKSNENTESHVESSENKKIGENQELKDNEDLNFTDKLKYSVDDDDTLEKKKHKFDDEL